MSVSWRGVRVCECMPDLLDDLAAAVGPLVEPMQGSYSGYSASAQTHAGGGAIDLGIKDWADDDVEALLVEGRKRGLVIWRRTPAQGFVLHAHGVVDGCPHLSKPSGPPNTTALWQVREYHAGRNGLAGRGRDDGPRDHVGATWPAYVAANPPITKTKDEEMPYMIRNRDGGVIYIGAVGAKVVPDADRLTVLEALGVPYGPTPDVSDRYRNMDIGPWRLVAELNGIDPSQI